MHEDKVKESFPSLKYCKMFLNCPFIEFLTLQRSIFFFIILPESCYFRLDARFILCLIKRRKYFLVENERLSLHLLHRRRDFGERMFRFLSSFLLLPFFFYCFQLEGFGDKKTILPRG